MTWQAICDNPLFRDMPFKFETNRWGKIEISPASKRHSRYQGLIAKLLDRLLADGEAISDFVSFWRKFRVIDRSIA